MEIEDQDGAKMELSYGRNDIKAVFGRGNGFTTDDRTVSRRHLAFEVRHGAKEAEPRVSFEVLGKNPVWVRRKWDQGIRVFRSSESGELSEGDWFCLSGNEPAWFNMRKIRTEDWETRVFDEEDERNLGSSAVIDSDFNVSEIDPVKEFGFIVMGHEFDIYPRHMIRDAKKWDWFLEEDKKENSDDEEEEEESGKRNQKGLRKKRKKGQEIEDGDWAGESEDDEQVVDSLRKDIRPNKKYTTRSSDSGKKPQKDGQGSRSSSPNKIYNSSENEDDEDETLGGFIVGDNDMDTQEEGINKDNDDEEEEEEEEEEILEDDDDEEDE